MYKPQVTATGKAHHHPSINHVQNIAALLNLVKLLCNFAS